MFDLEKNKKCLFVVLGVILIVVCIVSLSSGTGEIYGSWEVSEKSINENFRDYPEENFIIYENGSVSFDGYSGSYSMNKDTVAIQVLWFTYTYKYKVSGDTLMLKLVEADEDTPAIYYNRVK